MKQLTHIFKDGQMQVLEVPVPILGPNMLLVRNYYSLISTGTEKRSVSSARRSLIGKAKERPQQVKQVIGLLRQQGILQTYRSVMKKLESYSPLGYSSAGEVIDVATDAKGFSIGDFVACGGSGYASHAEIIAVPVNLCVKLHPDNDLKRAAYNTIGAIALHGVRQADVRIGETCAVIGLGLIGHLTCLMLRAGGIKVIGIDIDPHMVEIASKHGTDVAFIRGETGLAEKIDEFTKGIGVDAVIITAATDSLDPVNLAGQISRKKGRVVIVGDVPTGFDREPYYYQKELELRMSCSYGPGRYDGMYEEKGIDYPVGYVRWTENRNMQAFQELIHSGKINIDYLTTHVFKLDDAPSAYDMILKHREPFIGILIKYDIERLFIKGKMYVKEKPSALRYMPSAVSIAFIGAGSYAMSHLLPNIPKEREVVLKGVMTSRGTSSRTAAEKYGFEFCTSDENDIFGNHDINTVFIATRHNTHAEYVIKALRAGKHIYVEKPLCLTIEELNEIAELFEQRVRGKEPRAFMVGFNRRFSPIAQLVKEKVGTGRMSVIYRINAGPISSDSWIQDQRIGGGRIIGEVCHFVDFLTFLSGSLPKSVYATALSDPAGMEDTVNISLDFEDGSIGTISYFANGSKVLFKEYIEVFKAGVTGIIKDFKELEIYRDGKIFKKGLLSQDKGQKQMVRAFIDTVKNGRPSPIGFEEIYTVTLTTFKIMESLRLKQAVLVK